SKPGPIRRRVTPEVARSAPPCAAAALSSARTTVVPTATTRPRDRRVASNASTVASGTSNRPGNGKSASPPRSPPAARPAPGRARAPGSADAAPGGGGDRPPAQRPPRRRRLDGPRASPVCRLHVPERERAVEVGVLDGPALRVERAPQAASRAIELQLDQAR